MQGAIEQHLAQQAATAANAPLDMSKVAGATPGTPAPVGHAPALPYSPGLHSATALKNIGDVGIGALKGLGGDVAGLQNAVAPPSSFWGSDNLSAPAPTNTMQKLGKGAEQAAEFLIPGLGEEKAGAMLTEHLPQLGKLAAPLARLGTQTVGTGLVNKLQGGDFSTGALMGAGAGAIGEGAKAVAPTIAEAALKIRKLDRAYKPPGAIGRAALDETTGLTPSAVGESAQSGLDELNPQVAAIVDRASVRPNNLRGLLPAPPQEIPLGTPFVPEMPGDLVSAEPFPPQNVAQTRVIRNGQGQILPRSERLTDFPNGNGVMPPARNPYSGQMLPQKIENLPFTREAFMAGSGDELPPVIDQRIGPGVLLRRAEESATPIPSTLANNSASLRSSRGLLSSAAEKATARGERTTLQQLDPMLRHLTETVGGETIPENITPRQLLDMQQGFGNEFVNRWNPETMQGVKGTAAQTYHEMGNELDRVVPEAQTLRSRISPLITIAKRAKSEELNAPLAQRLAGRLAAHTGALTGAVVGGLYGYNKGGFPAAARDAAAGFVIPELLGSPAWQMGAARAFNSNAPAALGRIVGGGLIQAARKRTK
jgi:hypothetical protein